MWTISRHQVFVERARPAKSVFASPRPGPRTLLTGIVVLATLALSAASPGRALAGPLDYCDPAASLLDPVDVPDAGSPPVDVPGVRSRSVVVNGVRTRVLESANPRRRTAVLFLHGTPDSGADFAGMIRRFRGRTHAVAIDMPGFGHAEDAWAQPATPDAAVAFLAGALRRLGIRRVHLVAHDVGGFVGLEWASRHPKRLRSATLIDTGLMLGYEHSELAQITRSPAGERFWQQFSRASFSAGIQDGQSSSHQLPPEFVNRLYDDLDRETRCAIIKLYRALDVDQIRELALHQAEALRRRRNRPALVLWGANDPYLPVRQAYRQDEGFPSVEVRIFEESGHWPFIDFPKTTRRLILPFIREAVAADRARRG